VLYASQPPPASLAEGALLLSAPMGACADLSIGVDHIALELFMKGSVLPADYRLSEGKASVLFTDESPSLSKADVQQMLNN